MRAVRRVIPIVLAAIFSSLLIGGVAIAFAEGLRRSKEVPMRAILGDARYEALRDGQGGTPHYLGAQYSVPDFELPALDGSTFKMNEHRGKTLIINFWSITCPPCVEEMPALEQLALIASQWSDVEVIAISADQDWEQAKTIIADDSRITHLLDSELNVIRDKFGSKLFPETWIIDKAGVVRFRYDGAIDWANPVVLDVIEEYR